MTNALSAPFSVKDIVRKGSIHNLLYNSDSDYDRIKSLKEKFRPSIHFSPPRNFMNDPNGPIYFKDQYHIFFQYNPYGKEWGHMSWGHAVSQDLLHWKNLPVAIPEQDDVMIFSGSTVFDIHNSSGLGRSNNPPLVAIYTGHNKKSKHQSQNLAYSLDGGGTWIKYAGNPIIDFSSEHFRDPKVFWFEPSQQWIMVVVLADQKKVQIYGSHNLKRWDFLSDFGPAGMSDTLYWECPDLFELTTEDNTDIRCWILKVDVINHSVAGGSGSQYFLGKFDGHTFKSDYPPKKVLWVDHGKDFYAAQTFGSLPKNQRRTIWIGWMNNWEYANHLPTHPWRGVLTLPRELYLIRDNNNLKIQQKPLTELKSLRRTVLTLKDVEIQPNLDPLTDFNIQSLTYEILADFMISSASSFGLKIRVNDLEYTQIGFDVKNKKLYLDRRQSGYVDFHPNFPGRYSAPLYPSAENRIKIQVITDVSCVEVFGNQGEQVISGLIFPDSESNGIKLFSEGGATKLLSLEINRLNDVPLP